MMRASAVSRIRALARFYSSIPSRTADTQHRSVKRELESRFAPFCYGAKPIIVDAAKKVNADYAMTSAMEIFRAQKGKFTKPDDVAGAIIESSSPALADMCSLSQAKFYVNATLTNAFISKRITSMLAGVRLPTLERPAMRMIIDYSSPNIAKLMHVGHLRSTLIGNSIAYIRESFGDVVLRVNHLGDWGTQFGTLLQHMRESWGDDKLLENIDKTTLEDITRLYQAAKHRIDADEAFRTNAKMCTVRLQSGKDELLTLAWRKLVDVSLRDFNRLYGRLGVWNDPSWFLGESFYQNKLEEVLKDLAPYSARDTSNAAILLYTGLPDAKVASNSEDTPPSEIPLVLRKSDGGIGYDATDVAALRYRLLDLKADEVVYVTDNGQSLHFRLVFQAAKMAKWSESGQQLVHVPFGIVTKEHGGRIRTREGDIQTLDSLLNKAVDRMKLILRSKRSSWNDAELRILDSLAEPLGVFCVAFCELKTTRSSDYEFNVDKMCSPDGNSGLFVIHCIRKAGLILNNSARPLETYTLDSTSLKERALACELLKFDEVVEHSAQTYSPHILAAHLLNVASKTSSFIDEAKLMTPQFDSKRSDNHAALIRAADMVMRRHVNLLGLEPLMQRSEPFIKIVNTWANSDALF